MRIMHNVPALNTFNALNSTNRALSKAILKLSTGLRINSASDDAAGLAISERMRAQISGVARAVDNSEDGIRLLQTAEGALESTQNILQRMRELSVQAANDTLTSQDRTYIQQEIDQLKAEVDNIAHTTKFNGKRLLDGSSAALWSSSDLPTKAYFTGSLIETDQFGQKTSFEGNYKIEVNASYLGEAQVQKSNIFQLRTEKTEETSEIDGTTPGTSTTTVNVAGIISATLDSDLHEGNYIEGTYTVSATEPETGSLTMAGEYLEFEEYRDFATENFGLTLVDASKLTANGSIALSARGYTSEPGQSYFDLAIITFDLFISKLNPDGTSSTTMRTVSVKQGEPLAIDDFGEGAIELKLRDKDTQIGSFGLYDAKVYSVTTGTNIDTMLSVAIEPSDGNVEVPATTKYGLNLGTTGVPTDTISITNYYLNDTGDILPSSITLEVDKSKFTEESVKDAGKLAIITTTDTGKTGAVATNVRVPNRYDTGIFDGDILPPPILASLV